MKITPELQERVFAAGMHRNEPAFIEATKACPNCRWLEGPLCPAHRRELAEMYPDTPQCPPDCCPSWGGERR